MASGCLATAACSPGSPSNTKASGNRAHAPMPGFLPRRGSICCRKSERVGRSPPPAPFLILESLDCGCLLCSSLEPKLREGRTFASIVFTLVLAQGLTLSRCSVSVEERNGRRRLQSMREVKGRIMAMVPSFHLYPHPFTQSPSDPVSVLPHLEGRAWACCLRKTLDSYSLAPLMRSSGA